MHDCVNGEHSSLQSLVSDAATQVAEERARKAEAEANAAALLEAEAEAIIRQVDEIGVPADDRDDVLATVAKAVCHAKAEKPAHPGGGFASYMIAESRFGRLMTEIKAQISKRATTGY